LDQTRKQAKLTFAQTPARLIGDEGTGWRALSKMLDLAAVALAAEQVGGAQQILDVTVQYAKDREQFGQPIGSFQVIKHKCADMLLEVESARSAAYYAGWVAADDGEDLPIAASLAKSYCSEAYFHAAAESIQIHGGIGFTWEHDMHLYVKRAQLDQVSFGDAPFHRDRIATMLQERLVVGQEMS
jgi:alkylation response protein AidB-like acyl-CoA dehydrogenase